MDPLLKWAYEERDWLLRFKAYLEHGAMAIHDRRSGARTDITQSEIDDLRKRIEAVEAAIVAHEAA